MSLFDKVVSMNVLSCIKVFVAVVETRSLSEAGRRIGLTPSSVSKQISALEQDVGARLVSRTTRSVSVTDKGKLYYARCMKILEELSEARSELLETESEPRGHLHIIGPTVLMERHIARLVPGFLDAHPGLTMEMATSVDLFDLIDAGVDLAIRVGSRFRPEPGAIKLIDNHRVFCASPAYLARHGMPERPEDLHNHRCTGYGGERAHRWPVLMDDETVELDVVCQLTSTNGEVVRQAALGGSGITMLPVHLVNDDLGSGRLVRLLEQYETVTTAIYIVTPHKRYVERKTRYFIDYLTKAFTPVPPWQRTEELAALSQPPGEAKLERRAG